MSERPDLATVLAGIRGGDPTAMQTLYEVYAAQLYRFCVFRLGEVEAAQDVVQEVFLQAWHGLRTFEYRGDAALTGWLHAIALNAVNSYLRKDQRQPSVSLSVSEDWPQLHSSDMSRMVCERMALRQAIERLGPSHQQVIALRFLSGLSIVETALALGRSEGAIRSLQHRALQRLHQTLIPEAGPRGRASFEMVPSHGV